MVSPAVSLRGSTGNGVDAGAGTLVAALVDEIRFDTVACSQACAAQGLSLIHISEPTRPY